MPRTTRYCDGLNRRDFIQVGALGLLGLGLPEYLAMRPALGSPAAKGAADRSVIFLWLSGGPSHLDTWDLKPEAPAEIRGEFKPIRSNVPGIDVSDQLPLMARRMDQVAVVRSVSHNLASHAPGSLFMQTGNRPIASLRYPTYGSVVSRERPAARGVPPFVTVPEGGQDTADAGYMGIAYNTYAVGADPNRPDFTVRSLSMPAGMTAARLDSRRRLASDLDTLFAGQARRPEIVAGMDAFYQQAYDVIRSPRTRAAFDLSQEPDAAREAYGRTTFGQSCLLARRLVEAGVRFVQVVYTGWDTHAQNFERLKGGLLPGLDRGFAALLDDLKQRGLDASTTVLCSGEFGRTPKINSQAGRDHWSQGMSVLFAGAGVKTGQVIGSTTAGGEEPAEDGVTPEDVAATLYHLVGVDAEKEYLTPSGRPVAIVRDGTPIRKLLA